MRTIRSKDSEANTDDRLSMPFRILMAAYVLFGPGPAPRPNTVPATYPVPERTRTDRRHARLAWIVAMAIGAGGAAFAASRLGLELPTDGFDGEHNLAFRMLLAIIVAMILVRTAAACRAYAARFWTTWWDPSLSRPDGEIGWEDVLELTVGGERGDALFRRRIFRRLYFLSRAPGIALAAAAISATVAMIADGLLRWRLPDFVWAGPGTRGDLVEAVANASGNLTAYLALLAAAVSIIFTYHQLRAKVRADNRQAWIDRARGLLSGIIADADAGRLGRRSVSRRLELELMLNPREKDHRLLIFLIQRLALVRDRETIGAVRQLRQAVVADLARKSAQARRPALLGVLDEDDPGVLVSYVIRLSHVLLKREWERVKHTR